MTLKELAAAINKQLKAAVPEIPIVSKDIEEGFDRPSFYVDLEPTELKRLRARQLQRSLTVTIYFFPTDPHHYKLEMLDVQQRLEDAFNDEVVVNDGVALYTGEITTNKVDGVLNFSFDLDYLTIETPNEDDIPGIEELIFKG